MNLPISPSVTCLPPDDALRRTLHDEVHARPSARIRLPALITYVAVLHEGVSRQQEGAHLSRLPGQRALTEQELDTHFLRLRLPGFSLRWERHSEFTRYTLIQPLPDGVNLSESEPDLLAALAVPLPWLQAIPGRTLAAIQLVMLEAPLQDRATWISQASHWLGGGTVVGSQMGSAQTRPVHDAPVLSPEESELAAVQAWAVTQFRLRDDGFERMLVLASNRLSETRAGRMAARLLELETYRLMALRGLAVAKALGPRLTQSEGALAQITAQLENKSASDQQLLDDLVSLAAGIERLTAEHSYRFSATQAYYALVNQRIGEMRELAISGTQTLGEFMQRRLSPAMATVSATAQRLTSLSERVSRTSDLLRTRVDIAAEAQNQQLLEKLTRGQTLQLRLQSTVEGLSIAAISYYVISLLLYAGKALKAVGAPLNPELAVGALIPVVLWSVWHVTQKIHRRLSIDH